MSKPLAPADVLALLEASGRAFAHGASRERLELVAVDVHAALSPESFDLSSLEEAGVAAVGAADADEADADATSSVRAALSARDRVEYVLLGAELAMGAPPVLARDQQMFLAEFDHLVRPSLHRLTVWNELRGEIASSVVPSARARFWWWSEGAGISPAALSSLAAVAELVTCFPAARRELDALVQTASTLRAAAAARPPAKITRLAEWASRKRGGESAELRIAAASSEERITVAQTEDYDVAFRPPASVVVDIHVEPRNGATPFVRLSSGRAVSSALLPRTIHRYAIALDAEAIGEERLVVVIPLARGDVEIPIPPTDDLR